MVEWPPKADFSQATDSEVLMINSPHKPLKYNHRQSVNQIDNRLRERVRVWERCSREALSAKRS
jgi:hypothetical protein